MAQVTTYLPAGFSIREKDEFVDAVKEVFWRTLQFKPTMCSVYTHRCGPGDVCPDGVTKDIFVMISTTAGKSDDVKAEIAADLDGVLHKMLGEQCKGTTIIFDEHTADCVCGDGDLFSVKVNL